MWHHYLGQHRHFGAKEQENPILVEKLARKLARLHAMNVPIKKTGDWIRESFSKWYKKTEKKFGLKKLIEQYKCETLKTHDIRAEMEWLFQTIDQLDSPKTFTHTDLRGSNIMVTEPDDRIVLCDFENCSYGYRGVDLGSVFAEWNGWDPQKICDDGYHEFPDDHQIIPFLKAYADESSRLTGISFIEDKRNRLQHLLKEVKVFALVSNMFFVWLTLRADRSMTDPTRAFDKSECVVSLSVVFLGSETDCHLSEAFQ